MELLYIPPASYESPFFTKSSMITQLMVQPSHLMASGIALREFGNIYLFRFTDELQSRFEELLLKKK